MENENVIQLDQTKTYDITINPSNRATNGPWLATEILWCMAAAMSRRVVDPKVPDCLVYWGSDEFNIDGWISFTFVDSNRVTRFFERVDGRITGNLEYDRFLTDGKPSTYDQYLQVQGRNIRDLFRNYLPKSSLVICDVIYRHHEADAAKITNNWAKADFEYHLTSHRSNPMCCPDFDWEFITNLKNEQIANIYNFSTKKQVNNILDLKGGTDG